MKAAVILLLLLPGGLALAGTLGEMVADCEQQSAGDHVALGLCLQNAALTENQRLDDLYSALRASLRGDPARRLLTAQRAFVRYRDMHCTAIGTAGRESDNVAWQTCNLRLTLNRIELLERYPEP